MSTLQLKLINNHTQHALPEALNTILSVFIARVRVLLSVGEKRSTGFLSRILLLSFDVE